MASFLLIFIGTGSILMYKLQAGLKAELLPIALAWAFAVVVIVYAFGHVSGAHVNPSVTLGLAVAPKFPWKYVIGPLLGATIGALLYEHLIRQGSPPRARTGGGGAPARPAVTRRVHLYAIHAATKSDEGWEGRRRGDRVIEPRRPSAGCPWGSRISEAAVTERQIDARDPLPPGVPTTLTPLVPDR